MNVVDRVCEWLVYLFPGCRATHDGMVDGVSGRLPRSDDPYYLEGHRKGTIQRSLMAEKPLTPGHDGA
jgi:hypothetical protein